MVTLPWGHGGQERVSRVNLYYSRPRRPSRRSDICHFPYPRSAGPVRGLVRHNRHGYIQVTTSTPMDTSPTSRISLLSRQRPLTMVNFYKATRSFARRDKWLESSQCFGYAALVLLV